MDGVILLTMRQRQIAGLVAMGQSNREIAMELHLSEGTIKEYLSRLFKKLSLPNRTALALWVYRIQHSGD